MPNIKSQKDRVRQAAKEASHNKAKMCIRDRTGAAAGRGAQRSTPRNGSGGYAFFGSFFSMLSP